MCKLPPPLFAREFWALTQENTVHTYVATKLLALLHAL